VDMPHKSLAGRPLLPASVGGCTRLQQLTLRDMGLGGLCEELGCCTELKVISVPSNPLSGDVPESLNRLTLLEKFCIDNCHMTGRFLPMELFKRIAGTEGTYLYLANNSFTDIDFRDHGLNQYTTGELRPWRADTKAKDEYGQTVSRGPVAVSSFPGREFMQWMIMLMRNNLQKNPDVCVAASSELCVFLSEYATALSTPEAIDEWHAGGKRDSPTCQLHHRFFEAAAEASGGGTVRGHVQFGCMWFHKWALNQVRAVLAGHKRLLVFTLCPPDFHAMHLGEVGTCQKAEYAFLKSLQTAYPDVEVGVANVGNLEYFMREPLQFWNGNAQLDQAPAGCESIHENPIPFPREEYEQLVA